MHPQLKIERPTWKIKYISPYSPLAFATRSVWDKLWPWVLPIGYVLVLLALCALISE